MNKKITHSSIGRVIIRLVTFILLLFFNNSCGAGYDKYIEYTFYKFKEKNEIINRIKTFKETNKEYNVYLCESMDSLKSADSIYFNGLYNVYSANFYLPKSLKRVYCIIVCQDDSVFNTVNSLYLAGYCTSSKPQCDSCTESQFTMFPKKNLNNEQKCIKKEFESILIKIGDFEEK